MTIGFPNNAVGASRDTSHPMSSDESPCDVVPNTSVEKVDEQRRSPAGEILVRDPRTGNRKTDSHVPARIPATVPRPISRGPKGG